MKINIISKRWTISNYWKNKFDRDLLTFNGFELKNQLISYANNNGQKLEIEILSILKKI